MGFNSAFKGLKLLNTPGNGRLNNLNDPVLNVLRFIVYKKKRQSVISLHVRLFRTMSEVLISTLMFFDYAFERVYERWPQLQNTVLTFASLCIIIRFKQFNQEDATASQVYYFTFMCGSTRFRRLPAHHQEHTTALGACGLTVG